MNVSEFAATVLEQGWCIQTDWLPDERIAELTDLVRRHWEQGDFHAAGVGRGAARDIRHDIRGDRILWLDDCSEAVVRRYIKGELESLRLAFNVAGYLGLHEFEGHFAVYPPGAGYARHRDRFRDSDARVVSLILYLNRNWQTEDGGELRLYPHGAASSPIDIMPSGGTLAGFLSAEMEHEVLAARRERFSLTGWFRRRPLESGR